MADSKIYTKKGDKGETSTLRGKISKSDDLAEALGSIDEFNSWIGNIRCKILAEPTLREQEARFKSIDCELKRIQGNLMTINAMLAGKKDLKFKRQETRYLEKLIDKLQEKLPPLSNFIYPVGELQYARTLARRVERKVVTLNNQTPISDNQIILKYLNRLSDALFVMARWVNQARNIPEEIWKIS